MSGEGQQSCRLRLLSGRTLELERIPWDRGTELADGLSCTAWATNVPFGTVSSWRSSLFDINGPSGWGCREVGDDLLLPMMVDGALVTSVGR
jgi:hypothetical protein